MRFSVYWYDVKIDMVQKKRTSGKKGKKQSTKKDYNKMALALHRKLVGKLEVVSKGKLQTKDDWSTMYTPGVAAVSAHIAARPSEARQYTIKGNTVAVISDGSAVLGLGDIGPLGAMPVMEGKCAIFKEMAGVNAFPIVLDLGPRKLHKAGTQDEERIQKFVEIVKAIAPAFGGINLEDVAAPHCFEIERRLKEALPIPVMHDDQHGTAIVVLAGLLNAAKVVKKDLKKMKIVIVGAGAAGRAITLMLAQAGVRNVLVVDRSGIIHGERKGIRGYKKELAEVTNPSGTQGELEDAVKGADVLIGVSGPGRISKAHVEAMAKDAIVFALANPIPEIKPDDARAAGARIVATGRSDYVNQVNNSLAFPGIFRGALDNGVRDITDEMKIKAARKLAALVKKPTAEHIIPGIMAKGLVKAVASAIK